MASRRLAAALVFAAVAGTAAGQHLYKCGGTYQDRPCADTDTQKRFAHGRFDVERANPDTDGDCARLASEVLPLWKRLHAGESPDTLRAQIDARPISRKDRSDMRELLVALPELDKSAPNARSQLETRCMAHKQPTGLQAAAQDQEPQPNGSQAAGSAAGTRPKRR